MSVLSQKYFHDEQAAFAHLEGQLWPTGPICPHCSNADAKRIKRLEGEATRRAVLLDWRLAGARGLRRRRISRDLTLRCAEPARR